MSLVRAGFLHTQTSPHEVQVDRQWSIVPWLYSWHFWFHARDDKRLLLGK